MRIDERLYTPQYKRPEPGRAAPPAFDLQEELSATPADDVVQLSMGQDGVWRVTATLASDESTRQSSESSFAATFPRFSRLYHTLLRVYASNGLAQALEPTRGLLVDLYA